MNFRNISCIEIAGKLGLRKSRNGNHHCFNIAGHKRNDINASLNISKIGFNCFGCGIKGNQIELIKQRLKLDTKQAFEWLKNNFDTGSTISKR